MARNSELWNLPLVPVMLHLCQITRVWSRWQVSLKHKLKLKGSHRGYGVFNRFRETTSNWDSFGASNMVCFYCFYPHIRICVSTYWIIQTKTNVCKLVIILSSLWMSSPEEKYSDSASELSEDASSVDGLWQPDRLCQETDSMSGAESDARRLARRKLFIACAISLVFMTGEVIGERKNHRHHLPQMCQILY